MSGWENRFAMNSPSMLILCLSLALGLSAPQADAAESAGGGSATDAGRGAGQGADRKSVKKGSTAAHEQGVKA